MATKRIAGLTCVTLILLVGTLPAVSAERKGEIGIIGGAVYIDEALAGPNGDSVEPALGLRGGSLFSGGKLGWFVDALYLESETDTFRGTATGLNARTGFDLIFNPNSPTRWFVSLGGGYLDLDFDTADDYYSYFTSAGFGQRVHLKGSHHFRWEARVDYTLSDTGLVNMSGTASEDLTQAAILVGWTWGGDARSAIDSDADGVDDSLDRCPATPRNAIVDKRGCPADADADGVFDGIDRCIDSPPGKPVGPDGCPLDGDGDGVEDERDRCPETRPGAPVDETGCMLDADGDGVDDGRDMCANTAAGVEVSVSGCPKDSDGDGVYDGLDRCPGTPRGAEVDENGCPEDGDADGDGVPDSVDRCPDTPKGTRVDADGCPRAAPLLEDKGSVLVLEGVNFANNQAVLTGASEGILDRVAASLREWPDVRVEIGGYTDSMGASAYNESLSLRRAEAVRTHLVMRGVDRDRLVVRGYGESNPVADNATADGRARNRRVELRRLN